MFEDFEEYVREHYHRVFPTTLIFSRENVQRAYEVYKLGVMKGLAVSRAAAEVVGLARYPRLENFVKECGVYDTKFGWRMQMALVRTKGAYVSSRERLDVDFEVVVSKPFHLDKINQDFMNIMFFNCLSLTPFMLTPVVLRRWEYDIIEHEWQDYHDTIDKFDGKLAVRSTRGYEYEYGFSVEASKYTIWGEEKEGVKPHLWQVYLYERKL